MGSRPGEAGIGLSPEAQSIFSRSGAREIVAVFGEKDLLVDAGGLAFRILLALIPAMLFAVGVLGFFGLTEVWSQDIAPDLKASVSPEAFRFLDQAVTKVLDSRDLFWVTAGAALAAWEASAVVRAVGNMMNRIYEVEDETSFKRELLDSIPIGALAGLLGLAAISAIRLGPLGVGALLGDGTPAEIFSVVACWSIAACLLFALVAVVVRFAPAIERPPRWVSFGAATIVLASGLMTVLFVLYLTLFASYASVFGSLATVFILIEYVFLLSVMFLGGIVIDSILDGRERHD